MDHGDADHCHHRFIYQIAISVLATLFVDSFAHPRHAHQPVWCISVFSKRQYQSPQIHHAQPLHQRLPDYRRTDLAARPFLRPIRLGLKPFPFSGAAKSPYFAKIMGVFINMDNMIGKDFADGLARLQVLAEKA